MLNIFCIQVFSVLNVVFNFSRYFGGWFSSYISAIYERRRTVFNTQKIVSFLLCTELDIKTYILIILVLIFTNKTSGGLGAKYKTFMHRNPIKCCGCWTIGNKHCLHVFWCFITSKNQNDFCSHSLLLRVWKHQKGSYI